MHFARYASSYASKARPAPSMATALGGARCASTHLASSASPVYMQRTGAHRARQPAAFPPHPRRTTGAPLARIVRAQARAKHRIARAFASAARMPPHGAPARRRASQALREKPAGSRRGIAAIAKQYRDVLSEQPRKAEKRREPGAQDAQKALCRGAFLWVTSLCARKEK